MRKFFDRLIPANPFLALLLVIFLSSLILAVIFTIPFLQYAANNYQAVQTSEQVAFLYGLTFFVLFPFGIGILTPVIVGYKGKITIQGSIGLSQVALVGVGLLVLIFAYEGVICLIMAYPIVAFATLIGSLFGFAILQSRWSPAPTKLYSSVLVFLFAIPLGAFVESYKQNEHDAKPIITRIVINAPPEKVWKNVIEFPALAPPTELMFQTGIAYPIRARIDGSGVGAIRYCEFSTGAFVEPITVWDENKLLEFSVEEQPLPMKELSPYGELDTPHLHDFFVSRKGQFKLTRLENGQTLLEGTTWYYHKIKPEFYWRLWSEEIIHTIHRRVLHHIKERSEEN